MDQPENCCRTCKRPIAAGYKYCGKSDCGPNREKNAQTLPVESQPIKQPIKWREFL
jgi:hypothetical protein